MLAVGIPHSLTEPSDGGHAKTGWDESGLDTPPGPFFG